MGISVFACSENVDAMNAMRMESVAFLGGARRPRLALKFWIKRAGDVAFHHWCTHFEIDFGMSLAKELIQISVGVGEFVGLNAELLHQSDIEIAEERGVWLRCVDSDVPSVIESATCD